MGEPNLVKWVGVRQTEPPEPFHVQNRPAIGDEHLTYGMANNGNVDVLTVPAGHIYHLTAMSLMFSSTGVGECNSFVQDNVSTILFLGGFAERTVDGEYCVNNNMICPIALPAGYTVVVGSSNTAINAYLSLQYFDEAL